MMEFFFFVIVNFAIMVSKVCQSSAQPSCMDQCQMVSTRCSNRNDIPEPKCRLMNILCEQTCDKKVNVKKNVSPCLQECHQKYPFCAKANTPTSTCKVCHLKCGSRFGDTESSSTPTVQCLEKCYNEYFLCKQVAQKIMDIFYCTETKNSCKNSCYRVMGGYEKSS